MRLDGDTQKLAIPKPVHVYCPKWCVSVMKQIYTIVERCLDCMYTYYVFHTTAVFLPFDYLLFPFLVYDTPMYLPLNFVD